MIPDFPRLKQTAAHKNETLYSWSFKNSVSVSIIYGPLRWKSAMCFWLQIKLIRTHHTFARLANTLFPPKLTKFPTKLCVCMLRTRHNFPPNFIISHTTISHGKPPDLVLFILIFLVFTKFLTKIICKIRKASNDLLINSDHSNCVKSLSITTNFGGHSTQFQWNNSIEGYHNTSALIFHKADIPRWHTFVLILNFLLSIM